MLKCKEKIFGLQNVNPSLINLQYIKRNVKINCRFLKKVITCMIVFSFINYQPAAIDKFHTS